MSRARKHQGLARTVITHVSFDVFGTCLVRSVGGSSGVYRAIASKLAEQIGAPRPNEFAEDFIEWRSEAERRARLNSVREEVRLEEIWRQLSLLVGPDKLAGIDGPSLEMETERSVLRPIIECRERLARERSAGRRILFISDSYLPQEFLASILREYGFVADQDVVHVSSESGYTKHNGTLFRHVLATSGLLPAALHHIGAHRKADFEVPKRIGIGAELFSASQPKTVERLLLRRRPVQGEPWIALAGALGAARLSKTSVTHPKTDVVKFVEKFFGPFLCAFGHWILRRARSEGKQRLYFASRDGRLLWQVCQTLNASSPHPLDLRYLFVSRQALLLPSLLETSSIVPVMLRRDIRASTMPEVLSKFELDYAEWTDEWLRIRPGWKTDAPLFTEFDWAAFWKFLSLPRVQTTILAAAEQRRKYAHAYFAKAGLFDAVPMAFVDLGWFLTCQGSLNRIRRSAGAYAPLPGYYLALKRSRLGPAEAGEASSLFREDPADLPIPRHLAWINRSYLLDQIIGLADHASIRAYGENGSVEFAADSQPLDSVRFGNVESALRDYVTACGNEWEILARHDAHVAEFVSVLLNDFFENPSKAYVETLAGIKFSPYFGCDNTEQLIEPYSWGEVFRSAYTEKPSRHEPSWRWWPEASATATPRSRQLVRQFLGRVRNTVVCARSVPTR